MATNAVWPRPAGPGSRAGLTARRGRQRQDELGLLPPAGVLEQQRGDRAAEPGRPGQPGGEVALFQRLVERLDVVMDDQRGVVQVSWLQPAPDAVVTPESADPAVIVAAREGLQLALRVSSFGDPRLVTAFGFGPETAQALDAGPAPSGA